jgi:hypothetical protein
MVNSREALECFSGAGSSNVLALMSTRILISLPRPATGQLQFEGAVFTWWPYSAMLMVTELKKVG